MRNADACEVPFDAAAPSPLRAAVTTGTPAIRTSADVRIRRGQALVVAGFAVTVIGIVLYCAACFAGGVNRDLGELMFEHMAPLVGAALLIMGLGVLLWLIGSFMYLAGAMDADFPDRT